MVAFTAAMPLLDAVIEPVLTMAPPIEALLIVIPVRVGAAPPVAVMTPVPLLVG
jgi:hypothetical protein